MFLVLLAVLLEVLALITVALISDAAAESSTIIITALNFHVPLNEELSLQGQIKYMKLA